MPVDLAALLGGAASGLAATLFTDFVVRPRLERKAVAASLLAEVSANLRLCVTYLDLLERGKDDRGVAPDFRLATEVYVGNVSKLATLPGKLSVAVVQLYHQFAELNRLPAQFQYWRSQQQVDDHGAQLIAVQEMASWRTSSRDNSRPSQSWLIACRTTCACKERRGRPGTRLPLSSLRLFARWR